MTLAVTKPIARWAGGVNTGVNLNSTNTFLTTNGALLVVCFCTEDNTTKSVSASAASDSGSNYTFTLRKKFGFVDSGLNVYASIFTAPVTSAQTISINVQSTYGGGGTSQTTGVVYQVTGQNASFLGATGSGTNTLQNADLAVYTSTANNSEGFYCCPEFNDRTGVSSSNCTIDTASEAGIYSATSGFLTALTPTSGTGVTMNIQNTGGGVSMNWVAIEILPDVGAASTPLLGQACL